MIEQPFTYSFTGRFTNRKHRQVDKSIFVLPDAPFRLKSVMLHTVVGTVFLRLKDISTSFVSTENMHMDRFPWPIFPEMLFHPGSKIQFSVRLPESVNIGKKRPKFHLVLMGTKVYDVSV